MELGELWDDAWRRLVEAVARPKHPFHLATLSTLGPYGPTGRIVTLRRAEPGLVGCHCDVRSPKYAELRTDGRCGWTFYDPVDKVQVRLFGRAELLAEGEEADAAWARTKLLARRCYMAPCGPGEPLGEPAEAMPGALAEREPDVAESEAGRGNFCLLLGHAQVVDVVALGFAYHRRARYQREGGEWHGRWLAP